MSRIALIGAHLRHQDVEPVASVTAIPTGGLVLSALELANGEATSSPHVIRRAIEARNALLERATFIAFRWGSTAGSIAHAQDQVADATARWQKVLERNQGFVEMTFKVGGSSRPGRPDHRSASSGGEYLRRIHEASRQVTVDEELLARAETVLNPLAERSRRLRRPDGGAEIALLIVRSKVSEAGRAAAGLREEMPDRPFLFSGPWPLETFVDE